MPTLLVISFLGYLCFSLVLCRALAAHFNPRHAKRNPHKGNLLKIYLPWLWRWNRKAWKFCAFVWNLFRICKLKCFRKKSGLKEKKNKNTNKSFVLRIKGKLRDLGFWGRQPPISGSVCRFLGKKQRSLIQFNLPPQVSVWLGFRLKQISPILRFEFDYRLLPKLILLTLYLRPKWSETGLFSARPNGRVICNVFVFASATTRLRTRGLMHFERLMAAQLGWENITRP